MTYTDKSYYKGAFVNDKRHGAGRWVAKDKSYVGEWVNDKREGKGVLEAESGRFEGYFKEDKVRKKRLFFGGCVHISVIFVPILVILRLILCLIFFLLRL